TNSRCWGRFISDKNLEILRVPLSPSPVPGFLPDLPQGRSGFFSALAPKKRATRRVALTAASQRFGRRASERPSSPPSPRRSRKKSTPPSPSPPNATRRGEGEGGWGIGV